MATESYVKMYIQLAWQEQPLEIVCGKENNNQAMLDRLTSGTVYVGVPSHTEKRFQPKEFYLHVPKSIPMIREVPNTVIDLPITLNLGGGEAILLSNDHNPHLKSRDFWVDLCKRVEKLTETFSDETYGTIVEAKAELQLELWSLFFPTLIDKAGSLKHIKLDSVKYAHIIPYSWNTKSMAHMFSSDEPPLTSRRNGLSLQNKIEEAFDNHWIVVVPMDSAESIPQIVTSVKEQSH